MYEVFLGSSPESRLGRITTMPVYDDERFVLLQFGQTFSDVRK
jgi:hypothetical protein